MLCGKILIYGSGTSTSGGAAAGAAAAAPFDGSLLAVRLPVRPSRPGVGVGVPSRAVKITGSIPGWERFERLAAIVGSIPMPSSNDRTTSSRRRLGVGGGPSPLCSIKSGATRAFAESQLP